MTIEAYLWELNVKRVEQYPPVAFDINCETERIAKLFRPEFCPDKYV
jgi:hypothetical protein